MDKFKNKREFEFRNVGIYEQGYLKGYMQGFIIFSNQPECEYEFLYRIQDHENGDSFKLVSIDYGYKNNMVAKLWNEIENYCKDLYKYKVYNKQTNFIVNTEDI